MFIFDNELNISMKEGLWTKVELTDKFNVKFKMLSSRRDEAASGQEVDKLSSDSSVRDANVLDLEVSDVDSSISEKTTPSMFDPEFGVLNNDLDNTEVVLINTDEYVN